MTDDCKLMVRYLQGDAGALDELKTSFRPGLVDVIRCKIGDYDAAVEVLADMTFEKALERIAEWQPGRDSISAFLFHIEIGLVERWLPPIDKIESEVSWRVHDEFVAAKSVWPEAEHRRRLHAALRQALEAA